LKNEKDDAIFWVYELYYSGFQLKVILFLEFIYTECFENVNSPKVKRFLEKKIKELRIHPNKEWVLATIVATMCSRQCDMNCILVKQSGCFQRVRVDKKNRKLIYPIYQEKDIPTYKTVAVGDLRNWGILSVVCSRPTYKDSGKLIQQSNDCDSEYLNQILTHRYSREELVRMFRYEWEYYSYFTPIWKKRFEHYSAVLNHTTKKVEFPSENIEEMFYQKYGYEPDEQPSNVLFNCIGSPL
jgi:Asp-tRNA(Asn)/Glu-tRNA(Gln) amidotransferase A subunit family amidase